MFSDDLDIEMTCDYSEKYHKYKVHLDLRGTGNRVNTPRRKESICSKCRAVSRLMPDRDGRTIGSVLLGMNFAFYVLYKKLYVGMFRHVSSEDFGSEIKFKSTGLPDLFNNTIHIVTTPEVTPQPRIVGIRSAIRDVFSGFFTN